MSTHEPVPCIHTPRQGPSAGYRALCSACVWAGPWRPTQGIALLDFADHLEDLAVTRLTELAGPDDRLVNEVFGFLLLCVAHPDMVNATITSALAAEIGGDRRGALLHTCIAAGLLRREQAGRVPTWTFTTQARFLGALLHLLAPDPQQEKPE